MNKPNFEDNPKSIKYHVKKYILNHKEELKRKEVIDCPAGNGVTSRILKDIGAKPIAYDLFPEYFEVDGIKCERANVLEGLPRKEKSTDVVICQEGIEHFSDQIKPLKEFNRVLRDRGLLIITTPNYSNIRSKLSYFFAESERYLSMMPPNEIDSIWMSKQDISNEIYYGHIFLIGIQKLRVLGKLSGFKIRKIHFTRAKMTSTILLPLFYPWIVLINILGYNKSVRKAKKRKLNLEVVKSVYREQLKINLNYRLLVASHIFVEFEKEMDVEEVAEELTGVYQEFDEHAT